MKARHVIAIFFFLGIFGYINGYYDGKRAADRWYVQHQPVAATPQMNDMCADGDSLWGPPVKLIPPQKVKAKPPVASLQEPKPSFEIHSGPVSNGINGFECNAPVASVEEPR